VHECPLERRRDDPRYLTNQESTASELIVPVLDGDAVVGTLDIEDERTGAFTADDQALFEDLADALTASIGEPAYVGCASVPDVRATVIPLARRSHRQRPVVSPGYAPHELSGRTRHV
jgi:GAF domain-containing protein